MNETQQASFSTAYELYSAMLYRIAYLSVRRKSQAEDCVSETFLRYIQKDISDKSTEHQKAWLIRVCINICKNFNKRAENTRTTVLEDIYTHEEVGYHTAEVSELLSSLPPKANLALYLKYYEGLNSADIGKALNLSEGGVRSLLSRTCKSLRLELNNDEGE